MVRTEKSTNSLHYKLRFWVFSELITDLNHPVKLKQKSGDSVKKAMISLENDDINKATNHMKRAKKLFQDNPEVMLLENIIQTKLNQKKEKDMGIN